MFKRILLFLILLTSIVDKELVIAATERGNGGDAVVCRNQDGTIRTAQLFDYFEDQVLKRGLTPDLGPDSDLSAKVEVALKRLEKFAPKMAELFRAEAQHFLLGSVMLEDAGLEDIADTDTDLIPRNCLIEQVAVNREPVFDGDKVYKVDKQIWDKLSDLDKAGLALHEAIYRHFITLGHQDSKYARHFNTMISSVALDTMSRQEFIEHLAAHHVPTFEYKDNAYSSQPKTYGFFEDGELSHARLPGGTDLRFYRNGNVQYMSFPPDHSTFNVYGNTLAGERAPIEFFENGDVRSGKFLVEDEQKAVFKSTWYELEAEFNVEVAFGEDRMLQKCDPCKGWVKLGDKTFEVEDSFSTSGSEFHMNYVSSLEVGAPNGQKIKTVQTPFITVSAKGELLFYRVDRADFTAAPTLVIQGKPRMIHEVSFSGDKLVSGIFVGAEEFRHANGSTVTLLGGNKVKFNENEEVVD